MGYATANGLGVIAADLHLPRVGVWRANLTLASGEALAAGAAVRLETHGGLVWNGTVRRSGVSLGTSFAEIVGGAGGLPTLLPAKGYRSPTARLILGDILSACGEKLARTADAGLLARQFPFWARAEAQGGAALRSFVEDELGATWRVLPTGEVWIGADAWRPSDCDFTTILEEPSIGRVTIAADVLNVYPGQTLKGRRVEYIDHEITAEAIRSVVWTAPRDGQEALIRSIIPVDFLALYPCTVKAQSGQAVDVKPDDARIPELQAVPIRFLPGCEVDLSGKVLLGFEAGNPAKPYAQPWGAGTLTQLRLGGSTKVARLGDAAAASPAWLTWFATVGTLTGAGPPPAGAIATISEGSSVLRAG